jgi:hypothetical protein
MGDRGVGMVGRSHELRPITIMYVHAGHVKDGSQRRPGVEQPSGTPMMSTSIAIFNTSVLKPKVPAWTDDCVPR